MKVIPSLISILFFTTGCTVFGMTIPAMAQTSSDAFEDRSFVGEQNVSPDVASTTVDSTNFYLVGPSLLNSSNDAESLDSIANQINSLFDGDSDADEFLPEGMVVRGSNGSLQLGGEI